MLPLLEVLHRTKNHAVRLEGQLHSDSGGGPIEGLGFQSADGHQIWTDESGTASPDCREMARGGARGVNVGIYGSPMECLGFGVVKN